MGGNERVRVVMLGSPRTAAMFRNEIEACGLAIYDEATSLEERGPTAFEVLRYTFEVAGDTTMLYQAVQGAAKVLRERFPGVQIGTDGDKDK